MSEKKRTVSLRALFASAGVTCPIDGNVEVSGVSYDSRTVEPGDLFFAMKGVHADGAAFIEAAAKKGARAAVAEQAVTASIPVAGLSNLLPAMSALSAAFFEHPSKKIPVIGITGTNGKTTTTFLIENILSANKKTCGVIGTVNYRIGKDEWPAPNTTPMSIDVQKFLALMVDRCADAAVMEVSSHALAQHRVDDVTFACGVFTNLTQDHLDYHGTMEKYFEAKAALFRRREKVRAVVNIDDEYGRRLAAEVPEAITYGLAKNAKLRAEQVSSTLKGIRFKLTFPSGGAADIANNLLGLHNVYNGLSAAGAMLAYGLSESQIVSGLNQNHSVPGRLQRVELGQNFVVAVDYAHTHDALAQVLSTLRNTGPRRLICVFGAGGDRDKTKRPKMGRVAVEMADDVFVTSDNPRSEVPSTIMKDIEEGIKAAGRKNYRMIEDRADAIRQAIASARDGDVVLIAGKGHETYQIYGNKKVHFSDLEEAAKALTK